MKTIKLMMIALMMCFVITSCNSNDKQDTYNKKVELNAKLQRDSVISELMKRMSISAKDAEQLLIKRETENIKIKK